MEGFEDPFNRQPYPWGREDRELIDWFRALGLLRRERTALRRGSIRYVYAKGPLLAFLREAGEERLLCVFNAGKEFKTLELELELDETLTLLLGWAGIQCGETGVSLTILPRSGALLELSPPERTDPF